jgi:hypothetical protein
LNQGLGGGLLGEKPVYLGILDYQWSRNVIDRQTGQNPLKLRITRLPMPNYYLKRDGESQGPYPGEEISRRVASGEIKKDDLVRPEDSENWVSAGSLTKPSTPRATMLGHSHSHSAAVATLSQRPVTLQQVNEAWRKMNLPIIGMLFSIALPLIVWFVKSGIENGGGSDETKNLLPLAIFVGVIGFITFLLWLRNAHKHASILKASYEHSRG